MAAIIVLMITAIFLPLWKIALPAGESADFLQLDAIYQAKTETNGNVSKNFNGWIALLFIASAALAAYSISQYQNRVLQMKLGAINSMVIAVGLGAAMFIIYRTEQGVSQTIRGEFLTGFYLPVAAMLCNLISNRLIRRDHLLVQSNDRLR